jgi:hypothetical protein
MGTDGAWQQPGQRLIPAVPAELDPIGTSRGGGMRAHRHETEYHSLGVTLPSALAVPCSTET